LLFSKIKTPRLELGPGTAFWSLPGRITFYFIYRYEKTLKSVKPALTLENKTGISNKNQKLLLMLAKPEENF
jgi:hypothetical protein